MKSVTNAGKDDKHFHFSGNPVYQALAYLRLLSQVSDGQNLDGQLGGNLYDNAEDIFSRRPAIDAAAVVSDLIPLATYGLDQMQVLNSVHFAEDDVADVNAFLTGGF